MSSASASSPARPSRRAPDALSSFMPGSGFVSVSFSPIPMDAGALFDSLDLYPYGCTEQIVSRAMPLLYAQQMAALAGRKSPTDIRNPDPGGRSRPCSTGKDRTARSASGASATGRRRHGSAPTRSTSSPAPRPPATSSRTLLSTRRIDALEEFAVREKPVVHRL